MKIDEVTLRNFGPYYGEHRVALSTADQSPVIIIHGENTWGKTTFLNALRWCLYGRVRGIDRRDKPVWRLVNRDAYPQGERLMSVALAFTHGGTPFRLERQVAFQQAPAALTQFQERATLIENGQFVEVARIKERIGNILHEDISRFFLFDAEMLDEFERLVAEPGSGVGATVVKQQIEQALGMPALALAKEDLDGLHEAASRKQFRAIKDSNKGAAIRAEAKQVEDEIQSIHKDLDGLTSQRNALEQERDSLRDKRAQYVELQTALAEVDQVEAAVAELEAKQKEVLAECRKTLGASWWLPVTSSLRAEADRASSEIQRAQSETREMERLAGEASLLEASLGQTVCSLCGQSFPEEQIAQIKHRLAQAVAAVSDARARMPDTSQAATTLALLMPLLSGPAPEGFRRLELELRAIRLRLRGQERRKAQIEQRIGQHDREDIRTTEKAYDRATIELAAIGKLVDAQQERYERFNQSLLRLRRDAGKVAGANPRVATEAALCEALRDIFSDGIERFREKMRADVEREASSIFRALTTEPLFSGLEINDSYGLTIIDTDGRSMPDKSAGAAQIIALSLVGALNKCALREAPIVVDTPLGRLDKDHRANVLKFFPTMGRQVVFMPHSGEFDRLNHLKLLGSQVSREYRIVRENLQSRIAPFDS